MVGVFNVASKGKPIGVVFLNFFGAVNKILRGFTQRLVRIGSKEQFFANGFVGKGVTCIKVFGQHPVGHVIGHQPEHAPQRFIPLAPVENYPLLFGLIRDIGNYQQAGSLLPGDRFSLDA